MAVELDIMATARMTLARPTRHAHTQKCGRCLLSVSPLKTHINLPSRQASRASRCSRRPLALGCGGSLLSLCCCSVPVGTIWLQVVIRLLLGSRVPSAPSIRKTVPTGDSRVSGPWGHIHAHTCTHTMCVWSRQVLREFVRIVPSQTLIIVSRQAPFRRRRWRRGPGHRRECVCLGCRSEPHACTLALGRRLGGRRRRRGLPLAAS